MDAETLEDLKLSTRSYNWLKYEGINTVYDLCGWSETDLLGIRNLGEKSVAEIKAKLAASGRELNAMGRPCPDFSPGPGTRTIHRFYPYWVRADAADLRIALAEAAASFPVPSPRRAGIVTALAGLDDEEFTGTFRDWVLNGGGMAAWLADLAGEQE